MSFNILKLPAPVSLLLWAGIWEIVGLTGTVEIFPPFHKVLLTMVDVVTSDEFQQALLITGEAWALGLGFAILVGIPIGIMMGMSRAAERLMGVWVNILISAPLTAVVPALIPLLGIGQTTVIVTVFLFAVFIIVIDTEAGVRRANRTLIEMARSFGATPGQIWRKVLIFAALPEILAGLRLGMIRATKGVVIGQLIAALLGFGEIFEFYIQNFLIEPFWALVLVIFAIAYVLSESVALLERRIEYYAGRR
ncbi:MAG: ABC transporter permease subunit [Rhodospirillaceae bacterium]|jgi:NitT/TauT family transport system permease protein|nr:ABC transporter permease subunit [Rhodospirillaceae bacterium]MBT5457415.1 ABC transporter permease subunit [Rhodospirillaceae bacterium]